MPYIKAEDRYALKMGDAAVTPGQLNYLITKLIESYIITNGANYSIFNDIVGAVEGAKLEFYRRIVAPYEDKKREENGDVYKFTK